jgi:hypothetical protein
MAVRLVLCGIILAALVGPAHAQFMGPTPWFLPQSPEASGAFGANAANNAGASQQAPQQQCVTVPGGRSGPREACTPVPPPAKGR